MRNINDEKIRFDKEIDNLYKEGYPQKIEEKLLSLKTSDVGFRLGGTWAEKEAAQFLADELNIAGLDPVMEKIPVDVFDVKGAFLYVDDIIIKGSQIAGYRGTNREGITAELVYVKTGHKADYENISKDKNYFKDKLVLIDQTYHLEWAGWYQYEATVQGALGVILTTGEYEEGMYFTYADDTLAGQDGQNNIAGVPMIYISKKDGDYIKSRMLHDNESIIVTMKSDVEITRAADGGFGYNLLTEIPGKNKKGEAIMFSAHMDAHLLAGADDTGAVVVAMMIAKALMNAKIIPEYSIKFLFTSSEEYGICNTMYDWQHGAFCAFANDHPEWSGKISMMIGLEVMSEAGGHYDTFAIQESFSVMNRWIDETRKENKDFIEKDPVIIPFVSTIGDSWTASATGIPSICPTVKTDDYLCRYHSSYDNIDNIDYELISKTAKEMFRFALMFDKGILPYDFTFRAYEIKNLLNTEPSKDGFFKPAYSSTVATIVNNGGDQTLTNKLNNTVDNYVNASVIWSEKLNSIDERLLMQEEISEINTKLIEIATIITREFTSLDAYQVTAYPYQPTLANLIGLNEALNALYCPNINKQEVINSLFKTNIDSFGAVGLLKNGSKYSKETYYNALMLASPKDTDWSCLAGMTPYLDLYPQYEELLREKPNYNKIINELELMKKDTLNELNNRISKMIDVLENVTIKLNNL